MATTTKDPFLQRIVDNTRYTQGGIFGDEKIEGYDVGTLFRMLDTSATGPFAEKNQFQAQGVNYIKGTILQNASEGKLLDAGQKDYLAQITAAFSGREESDVIENFDKYMNVFTGGSGKTQVLSSNVGADTNKNFFSSFADYFEANSMQNQINNLTLALLDIPYDDIRRDNYEKRLEDLKTQYALKTADVNTKSDFWRKVATSGNIVAQSVDQAERFFITSILTQGIGGYLFEAGRNPVEIYNGISRADYLRSLSRAGKLVNTLHYTTSVMLKGEAAEMDNEMAELEDENGNRIPLDIRKKYAYKWGLVSAATEIADDLLTPFGQVKIGNVELGKFLTKIKDFIKANPIGGIGLFAGNIAFQSAQEGAQRWIRQTGVDAAVRESNALGYTNIKLSEDRGNEKWQSSLEEFVDTLIPMSFSTLVTGGATYGASLAYGASFTTAGLDSPMRITSKMKGDANKYFTSDRGQVYDIGYADTVGANAVNHYEPKKTEDGKPAEQRKSAPILLYINKNTGALVPIYTRDRQYLEYLRSQGVTGFRGMIVSEEALNAAGNVTSAYRLSSVLAMRLGEDAPVMGYDGETIIMETQDGVEAAIEDIQNYKGAFSENEDTVEVMKQEDGSYRIVWENARGGNQTVTIRAKSETDQMFTEATEETEATGNVRPVRKFEGNAMKDMFDSSIRKSKEETLQDEEVEMAAKFFYKQLTGLEEDEFNRLWGEDYQSIIEKLPEGVDETVIEEGARFMPLLSAVTGRSIEDLLGDTEHPIVLNYTGEAKKVVVDGVERSVRGEFGTQTNKKTKKREFVINLSNKADQDGADTLVHELMHLARRMASKERLEGFKKAYGQDDLWYDDIKEVDGKYVFNGKQYDTRRQAEIDGAAYWEERFVQDFFTYLKTGQAPNAELATFFGQLKQFLQSFLNTYNAKLSDDTKRAFEKLLNGEVDVQPGQSVEQAVEDSERTLTDEQETPLNSLSSEAQRQYDEVVAKYKGTDQWLKAPNGKPTNLTERQWVMVRTPNFIRWFGDWINDPEHASKVLDENGEPLVVNHISIPIIDNETGNLISTNSDVFSRDAYENGFWFSDNVNLPKDLINGFAPFSEDYVTYGFLNIREPLIVDAGNQRWNWMEVGEQTDEYEEGYHNIYSTEGLANYAEDNGYDGLIIKNVKEGSTDYTVTDYAAFASNQIKSATDNNGEFSKENDSILYSLADDKQWQIMDANTQRRIDADYEYVRNQYYGTDKWMKAPNGQPTNLTERQWIQVRTPAFKAWFGDWENDPQNASKVLDENGEPKVVYHGATASFVVFAKTSDIGYHFGTEAQAIEAQTIHYNNEAPWFGTADVEEGEFPMMELFLNLRNPVTGIEDPGTWTADNWQLVKDLRDKGFISDFQYKWLERMYEHDDLFNRNGDSSRMTEYLKNALVENGYDGIIYKNMFEAVGGDFHNPTYDDSYMVFNSNQAKSATDNVGTFSRENDSILYSLSRPMRTLERDIESVMAMGLDARISTEEIRAKLGLAEAGDLSVSDIVFHLAEYTRKAAEAAGIDLTLMDSRAAKFVGDLWANEIASRAGFMPDDNNPIGWYSENVADALRIYSEFYPELKNDTEAQVAFLIPLAITSNGETVLNNGSLAAKVYDYYKEHGRFPTTKEDVNTVRWQSMTKGFDKINLLMDWGMSKTNIAKLLLTGMTPDEIITISGVKSLSGVSKDANGVLFSNILGPKIGGGFLANLLGWHKVGTFDLWMNRLMKRSTGLVEYYDKDTKKHKAGEVKDSMNFTVTQRRFMTAAIEEAVKIYNRTHTGTPLTVADAQAVLWYNEKNLYDKIQKQAITSIGASYVDSAGEFLAKKTITGYNEIKDTAKKAEIRKGEIQRVLESYRNDERAGENALESGATYDREGAVPDGGTVYAGDAYQSEDYAGPDARGAGDQGLSGEVDAGYGRDNEDQYFGGTSFGDLVSGRWLRDAVSERSLFGDGQRDRRSLAGRGLLSRSGLLNTKEFGKEDKEKGTFEPKSVSKKIGDAKFLVKSRNTLSSRYTSTVWFASAGWKFLDINKVFYELDGTDQSSREAYVSLMEKNALSQKGNRFRLSPYTADTISKDRIFISEDGYIGFRITEDGDLVGVVAHAKKAKGAIYYIMPMAIANKATKLDCFASDNSQLPRIYSKFGFKAVSKTRFDFNELDPSVKKGWKANNLGEPDIVFMVYDQKAANDNFEMEQITDNIDVAEYNDYGTAWDIQSAAVETLRQSNIDNDTYVEEAEIKEPEGTAEGDESPLHSLSPAKQAEVLQARKDEIQKAVEAGVYVSTEYLNEFRGEPWADLELELRDWMAENPEVVSLAREADSLEKFKEEYNKKYNKPAEGEEQQGDADNDAWLETIYRYSNASSLEDRDRQFVAEWTASEDKTLELAKTLREYMNGVVSPRAKTRAGYMATRSLYNSFRGVDQKVRGLQDGSRKNTKRATSEQIQEAQRLIQENPRAYRNAYMLATANGDVSNLELIDDDIAREMFNLEQDQEEARTLKTDYRANIKDLRQKINDAERDIRKAGEDPEKLDAEATKEKLETAKKRVTELKAMIRSAENEVDRMIERMGNEVEKVNDKLEERRARVRELRSQLTDANVEVRRLNNALDALRRWKEAKLASDYRVKRIRQIKRLSEFNPASIDAAYAQALFWVNSLFDMTDEVRQERRSLMDQIAAVKAQIDAAKEDEDTSALKQKLLYLRNMKKQSDWLAPPSQLAQYLPDLFVRADNRPSAWTAEELDNLLMALKQMRHDGKIMLEQKQTARLNRLLSIGYQYFMDRVGRMAQLGQSEDRFGNVFDYMSSRALEEDINTSIKEAKDPNAFKAFFLSYAKLQRLARLLDGDREGVLYNWFVRENWKHQGEELTQIRRRMEAAQAEWKRLGLKASDLAKEGFKGTKQNGTEYSLTRGQMIGVYVYSLNEIGKEKLMHYNGNNISEADINEIVSKLTPEEKAWGDFMLQDFEDNWQRLADVYYRGWNMLLGKRDNYFTFVPSDGATEAQLENGMDPQGDIVGKDGKVYTEKGFTKQINPNAVYPLELDVTRSWNWQVRKQEHFIAYGEWAKDTQYLFDQSQILNLAERTIGKAQAENFKKIVNFVIGGETSNNDFDKAYTRWLAKRNSAVLIGNVGTILKQGPSWFAAFNGDVNPADVLKNAVAANATLRAFLAEHPEIADMMDDDVDTATRFIWANAPEMKNRQIDMDIAEQLNRMDGNRFANLFNPANRVIAKWTMGLVDRLVVNNLWMAKYYTEFEAQKEKGKTDAQAHQEAVFKASQFISETQPTSMRMDQSAKQIDAKSSSFLRGIMVFTNQIINTHNQLFIDVPMAIRNKNRKKWISTIASTAVMLVTVGLLSGRFWRRPDEDGKEYIWRLARELAATAAQVAAPGFGSIIASGIEYDSAYSSYIFGLDTIGKSIKKLATPSETKSGWEKLGDVMIDLATEAGYAAGVPVTPLKNLVKSVKKGEPGYMLGGTWGQIIESLR